MNAVITGATKGIGKAIALKLAQEGYNLAVCARTATDVFALQKELEAKGVKVLAVATDCSIKEDLTAFLKSVSSIFETVDVLINNVATFLNGNLLDEPDDHFELQQRLNVNAAYYCSKYFGKIMREQGFGHIFNICSIASKKVMENAGAYTVTKTSLLSLNNVLRKELSVHHIKVTAILPGSTLTDSWAGTTIDASKFVQPDDIANTLYTILNLSAGVNVDEIVLTPLNFNS